MTSSENVSQPTDPVYYPVAQIGDLQEGNGKSYTVQGRAVALFYTEGKYFAISDHCPHQGAPLSGGHVEEGQVMCPWHAWKFKLEDGSWTDSPNSPVRCASYPVRIEGEEIQVGIFPDPDEE